MSNCGEAWNNKGIECPYCGHLMQPEEAGDYSEDEESHHCDACDQGFVVSCNITYSWTSYKI